ncbi:MAG: YdiU family protein [Gammaproteobacteria bacterium TMED104]|nr:MAG: YdiU family protein [Gammaproteobacteria bacterium TMED104]
MGAEFYSALPANPPADLKLIIDNSELRDQIGLTDEDLKKIQSYCLNPNTNDFDTFAMVYAGHQFGQFVNQLGDGRGIFLGQTNHDYDLHLKGAGKTPYSRFGDGRAVLRSSIREYIASEVMNNLNIPSTRAVALFISEEKVLRDSYEPSAVLLRSSQSHIRFGHFEFFHYRNKSKQVKKLADYAIENYSLFAESAEEPYVNFFQTIVKKTAQMISKWQGVGFCHGVMNTDNFSILGETFDYGPYAFMESLNPEFICNTSDYEGRYRYSNQPYIGLWNCSALGEALKTLIPETKIEEILKTYEQEFSSNLRKIYLDKLGLTVHQPGDDELIQDYLSLINNENLDYTQSFRSLVKIIQDQDLIKGSGSLEKWKKRFLKRHEFEKSDLRDRLNMMKSINPHITPKNFQIQKVIDAVEKENYEALHSFCDAFKNPFEENSKTQIFDEIPGKNEANIRTSCSS